MIKKMIPLVLLFFSSCQQVSTFETSCSELDAVDLEMLSVHKAIQKSYQDDKRFLKRLQDAQVYWTQYKDRHVRSLYPLEKKYYEDNYEGTYGQCKCMEAARLTRLRIKELKVWLDGPTDQDCPTSIK